MNLTDLFITLAKIDSVSGEEKKLAEYVLGLLKKQRINSRFDRYGNIYAFLPGKGKPVFFSAHLDTVSPGKGIKPLVRNGFIVAAGKTILGADNKVALACILKTVYDLQNKKIAHCPLEIIFTRSEEIGNYGAINFDYHLLKSKIGYCFDYPSPVGTIISASPFYERFDLELIGKAAHASQPEKAINILPILQSILQITKLGKIDTDSLINIGVIQGGDVRNTIPGKLLLQGEIRSFQEKKLSQHKKQFLNNLQQVVKSYHAKYKIDFVRENSGYKHNGKFAQQQINLLKNKFQAIKIKTKILPVWGVSDANIFNDHGLFCLNLGDGCENTHTAKERIKITQMDKLAKIMLKLSHEYS